MNGLTGSSGVVGQMGATFSGKNESLGWDSKFLINRRLYFVDITMYLEKKGASGVHFKT